MALPIVTINMDALKEKLISECQFDFIHASGPGGQNVHKVASAVQLRFDVCNSHSLSDAHKQQLIRLAGRRVSGSGILTIEAKRYRDRERNRLDALSRLFHLVEQAITPPANRQPSRPTLGSIRRRLAVKKKHSELKRSRQQTYKHDDES